MIAARVQHHPARAALLPPLLAALEPIPTEVVTDPDPDGKRSPYRTYIACLTDLPDCTHLLVVQDDARPCRNLPAALGRIAAANPEVPVALCVTTNFRDNVPTIRRAAKRGDNYVRVFPRWAMPMIAVLWPRSAAERFRDWALANPRATGKLSPRSDDAVGGAWMSRQREPVLATVPSLVEHEDTVPSLIRQKGHRDRKAVVWIGDRDPLEIDWSRVLQ